MKREPLFKAKRIGNGAWVNGFYSNLYDGKKLDEQAIITYQNFYQADMSYPYPSVETIEAEVDPKTVCEYAGFSDKNGEDVLAVFDNTNIIQSAYEMLIWVVENGYLKTK